jgi:tetratricopeptide (TPR) repeat protein
MVERSSGAGRQPSYSEGPAAPAPSASKGSSGVRAIERRTTPPSSEPSELASSEWRANHALQRAEQLLARQKLQEAEIEIRIALRYQPGHAKAVALYAWIQAFKANTHEDLEKNLQVLTDVLEKNPIDETIRFRRAQLLTRLGKADEAVRECRLIVELNPRHVDAQREIRLWEMRNRHKRAWFG